MVSAKLDFGSRFTHSFSTNGPRYEAQYRTWYSLSAPSVQSRAVDTVVYFRFDSVYCPWPAALLHCSTLQRYCSQLYVHSWYGTKLVWIYWYTRRPCLILHLRSRTAPLPSPQYGCTAAQMRCTFECDPN
jgi:hypothetical protein